MEPVPIPVPGAKNPKTEDLGSSLGFWPLVKIGKPELSVYIYNNNFLIFYIYIKFIYVCVCVSVCVCDVYLAIWLFGLFVNDVAKCLLIK